MRGSESELEIPNFFQPGAYVVYSNRWYAEVLKVESVKRTAPREVRMEHPDDDYLNRVHHHEDTECFSAAYWLNQYRPATADEAAQFERRYAYQFTGTNPPWD